MSEIVLICPKCHTEYREGFSVCSECDVPLVRRLDSEAADRLVPLAREGWFDFIADLLDRLEKEDVPYVVEAGTALELLDSETDGVAKPEPWEARVWVAQSSEARAFRLLEQLNAEWEHERRAKAKREDGAV